jgi:hypothetical protein
MFEQEGDVLSLYRKAFPKKKAPVINREKHRLTTPTRLAYIRHLMKRLAGARAW